MLLLGKKFSAHEALKANLLNDVFPEKEDKFVEKVRLPPLLLFLITPLLFSP
jgi:enoyl-CoA hydratase/carnithine racemase